jgi:hypothetical protein
MGTAKEYAELLDTIFYMKQRQADYEPQTDAWWDVQHAITIRTARLERMKAEWKEAN